MARDAVAVLVKPIEEEGTKLGVASLRAGVKCIGTLLIGFCDLNDWESLQIGFALLLKFAIDKRPKVVSHFFDFSEEVLYYSNKESWFLCFCFC